MCFVILYNKCLKSKSLIIRQLAKVSEQFYNRAQMLHTKYKYIVAFLSLAVMLAVPSVANAAIPVECADGFQTTVATADRADNACDDHRTGTPTADSVEAQENADASRGSNLSGDCSGLTLTKDNCGIVGYIVTFINVLSAAVGVVIVIMIAVGGIQYTASRDDPQMVNVAKQRIQNAVLALVFYLFAFAFLQWLVPGGIF